MRAFVCVCVCVCNIKKWEPNKVIKQYFALMYKYKRHYAAGTTGILLLYFGCPQ